jgi:hypothetical protein
MSAQPVPVCVIESYRSGRQKLRCKSGKVLIKLRGRREIVLEKDAYVTIHQVCDIEYLAAERIELA